MKLRNFLRRVQVSPVGKHPIAELPSAECRVPSAEVGRGIKDRIAKTMASGEWRVASADNFSAAHSGNTGAVPTHVTGLSSLGNGRDLAQAASLFSADDAEGTQILNNLDGGFKSDKVKLGAENCVKVIPPRPAVLINHSIPQTKGVHGATLNAEQQPLQCGSRDLKSLFSADDAEGTQILSKVVLSAADGSSPMTRPASVADSYCGWCQPDRPLNPDGSTSTGLCPACLEQMKTLYQRKAA